MSAPKAYGSIIEEIQKAAETEPWTEETVSLLLSSTLNGGLVAIAEAHNKATVKVREPLVEALKWISSECGREAGLRADAALEEIK